MAAAAGKKYAIYVSVASAKIYAGIEKNYSFFEKSSHIIQLLRIFLQILVEFRFILLTYI